MDPSATSTTPSNPWHLCNAEVTLLCVLVKVNFSYTSLHFPVSRTVLSASTAVLRNAALVYSYASSQSRLSFSRCSAAALFISHAIPLSRTPPIAVPRALSTSKWPMCCHCNLTAQSSGPSAMTFTFSLAQHRRNLFLGHLATSLLATHLRAPCIRSIRTNPTSGTLEMRTRHLSRPSLCSTSYQSTRYTTLDHSTAITYRETAPALSTEQRRCFRALQPPRTPSPERCRSYSTWSNPHRVVRFLQRASALMTATLKSRNCSTCTMPFTCLCLRIDSLNTSALKFAKPRPLHKRRCRPKRSPSVAG
jgi:hypothetical protein